VIPSEKIFAATASKCFGKIGNHVFSNRGFRLAVKEIPYDEGGPVSSLFGLSSGVCRMTFSKQAASWLQIQRDFIGAPVTLSLRYFGNVIRTLACYVRNHRLHLQFQVQNSKGYLAAQNGNQKWQY